MKVKYDRAKLPKEIREQRRQSAKRSALDEHVRRAVDEAPPLTDEQRERIARILSGARNERY